MKIERKKNTIRSFVWGIGNKTVEIILPFISRTFLITYLGSEYVGLGSLFTSILQMLNITELGFNSAVVFSMYKPIVDNDEEEICALLKVFRLIYRIIGCIVMGVGVCLIPFLSKLIKGEVPEGINITIIFLMYLINTAIGYELFAFKKSLLTAYHRQDVLSKINSVIIIVQKLLEIYILIVSRNYYLVLSIMILGTALENISVQVITKRMFPTLSCKGKLNDKTRRNLIQKVKGLMIQKVCSMSRNSIGNIVISIFVGLLSVTLYNNYYMIMTSVRAFAKCIINAMQAGVGNSIVENSPEENYQQMQFFDFMYMCIVGILMICLMCLYQPFMILWLGEAYILPNYIVILISIYFYSLSMVDIRSLYTTGAGLWWEGRFRSILEAAVNVALTVVLGYFWGITGVIVATIMSVVVINFGYGTTIVFQHYFKNGKMKMYYLRHMKYILITMLNAKIVYAVCGYINGYGVLNWILRLIVCTVLSGTMYFLVYMRCPEGKKAVEFLKELIYSHIKRKRRT